MEQIARNQNYQPEKVLKLLSTFQQSHFPAIYWLNLHVKNCKIRENRNRNSAQIFIQQIFACLQIGWNQLQQTKMFLRN